MGELSSTATSLIEYCTANRCVCPEPVEWQILWGMLPNHQQKAGGCCNPPLPLILAASSCENWEKRLRLRDHIQWADDHGVIDQVNEYLRGLSEAQWDKSEDKGRCWPDTTHWNSLPREKPSADVLANIFKKLADEWKNVVGLAIADATKPVAFTGTKRRRLVVAANPAVIPPWGSWNSFVANPTAFREFRSAINAVLAPHEVDHVSFEVKLDSPFWGHSCK
jgi:hypothetical protein